MGDKSEFDSGAIDLKIADTDNIEFTENEGGSAFAFVSQGRLFSYNVTNNKLAYIFGFYDEASDDPRCTHTDNSIRILEHRRSRQCGLQRSRIYEQRNS